MDNIQTSGSTRDLPLNARLVTLLTLSVTAVICLDFWHHNTFTKDLITLVWFLAILDICALSHFVRAFDDPPYHGIRVAMYHLALAAILIFVVPTASYYAFIWVLLCFVAVFYYQKLGMMVSLLAFGATLLLSSVYQQNGFTSLQLRGIVPVFLLVAIVSNVLGMLALGNREERLSSAQKASRLEYEHQRLVSLVNSINDAVVATENDGLITIYNAAALALIDTHADITGKNIADVISLLPVEGKRQSLNDIAHSIERTQQRSDLVMQPLTGEPVALDVTISKISTRTPLAAMEGFTFLLRDITSKKSLDEERDLFISEVSHELRTPLTIAEADISMAGVHLEKEPFDKMAAKETIEQAHKEVVFLSEMVNDLSTLSRAENASKDMDVSTFDLKPVIEALVKDFQPKANEKNLYIHTDIRDELPKLHTSVLYVQEILQNLISNAIKYTNNGGVTVNGFQLDGGKLRIDVADTGAGISANEQPKVFEKFWRSEDALTRSTGGTGLGLYISAKLARRIRAELTLTSQLQKGSTFSLIIPFVATQEVDKKNLARDETAHLFE